MHLRITTALAALALFAVAGTAHAQDPEAGDTGQWQQPNNGQQGWGQPNNNNGQPPQGGWQQPNNGNNAQQGNPPPGGWQQPNNGNAQQGNTAGGWGQDSEHAGAPHGEGSGGAEAPSTDNGNWTNEDNHLGAFHHLGVGFFGVLDIPTHDSGMATDPVASVSAPTIGGRYWINDLIGFEGAIGIGFGAPSATTAGTGTSLGTQWGVAFHVALPLALAHWKHFAFIVQPEVDLGIGGGDDGGDYSYSGFLFRIGGRIGGEIHMGFIGIPQLSLQAGIGLHLQYTSASSLFSMGASGDHGFSALTINTSIEKDPWDWFTGSITAIYYL